MVYCTSKHEGDRDTKIRWLMFGASCMMVLLQCCTAMAVVIGTIMPSCFTNNQCPLDMQGHFCSALNQRCHYCGKPPLEIVEIAPDGAVSIYMSDDKDARQLHEQRQESPGWKTLNQPTAKNFVGFNTTHVRPDRHLHLFQSVPRTKTINR